MDIDHLIIKHSTVTDKVPEPEDLLVGELAINTADGLAFTKHSDGTIVPVGGGGGGGMQASVYDPQGIEDDAFDRVNHTGTQAIATVSGLQASLDGKEPANANIQSHISSTGNVHGVTAEQIIGLGTAAMADSSAFATATQGGKADSALQPNAGLAAIDSAANTKLGGIAAGATANATDAQLRDRGTHTGTQPMASIGDKQGKVLDDLTPLLIEDLDSADEPKGYLVSDEGGLFDGTQLFVQQTPEGLLLQTMHIPLLGKSAFRTKPVGGAWSDFSFTIAPFDIVGWHGTTTAEAANAVINADGTFSRSIATFNPSPLLVVSGASHAFDKADVNQYARYTASGAKTATFDSSEGFEADDEFHIANRAASGNITISGTGVTFNAPKNGTLVLEPADTVTVKFISPTEADVMGSVVAPEQIIQGLFAQGQQGFWLPFTDFASLSQDSAGTLPYTALEQPVGRVLDRSGRGNHASQPTSTARPKITQAVGQPKFLTFDSVDDRLQATLPAITGTWIVGYKEGTLVYKVAIPAGAFPIGTNSNGAFNSQSRNFVGMVLRSGDLAEVEVSAVERYLVANGAGAAGVDAFAGVDSFFTAWRNCSSLTSFPLINTSAGTNFSYAWDGCASLASFPLINTAKGASFYSAWSDCSSLASFPAINTSAGTDFGQTWFGCTSLTSFPLINTAAGINFQYTWQNCSSLTSFPANMFDSCTSTSFNGAFQNCALSQASVDGILASLVTAGESYGTLNMHGGTSATPSAAGLASKATLVSRGWTVTHN